MDQVQFLEYLISKGIEWANEQRNSHRPAGRVLSLPERAALAPFFPSDVLADVRLVPIPVIQNLPFYGDLAGMGLSVPPRQVVAYSI
jgi:hypothetical protein